MAKRWKTCVNLRANLISTKVNASHRKSTQVHASPGQTESQVGASWELGSTCESVWPGLKKHVTKFCLELGNIICGTFLWQKLLANISFAQIIVIKLGYQKDSNATADSVASSIFDAVIHLQLQRNFIHNNKSMARCDKGSRQKNHIVIWTMFGDRRRTRLVLQVPWSPPYNSLYF